MMLPLATAVILVSSAIHGGSRSDPRTSRPVPAAEQRPRTLSDTEARLLRHLQDRGLVAPAKDPRLSPRDPRWRPIIDAVLAERRLGWLEFPDGGGISLYLLPTRGRPPVERPPPAAPPGSRIALAWERFADRRREAAQRLADMTSCYARTVGVPTRGPVSVAVDLVLEPSGRVKDVLVDATPRAPETEGCVVGVASTWTFPPSFRAGQAAVRFTLAEGFGLSAGL